MSGVSTEAILREAEPRDATAVAAIVNAHSASFGLPEDATADQVAAWWTGENVEAVVLEDDGRVIGFGDVYVRADHSQVSALGAQVERLLDAMEARAAAHHPLVRIDLHEADPAAGVLASRGYRSIRAGYDMEIDLDGELEPPEWPEGVSGRRPTAGDAETFWRVQEEAFADHWGYQNRSFDEWSHLYGAVRPFDPDLWLLAEARGEPVGVAICERGREGDEETGWVHVIGVLRPWRGLGLGLALLRWSFGALAGIGMRHAGLSVDAENTTGAVRLYERGGMHVAHRFETWERRL
jgi:GNAT superfamily N-acetyltransferase